MALFAFLCVGASTAAHAQEMEVPVDLQIPLFVKVMSFDRSMTARSGRSRVIAIVFQSKNVASTKAREDAERAVLALARGVGGVTYRAVTIDLDGETLAAGLRRERTDFLYITPLRGVDIGAIATAAQTDGVVTWTGVPKYLTQGVAVGLRRERERPRIMINLRAARLQLCDFSAELLKLAQIL